MWQNIYRDGDQYLQNNAKMKKWINQCVQCQAIGYKPEMPDSEDKPPATRNAEFMNIRYRFKCLPLNEEGLCEVCENFNDRHN